MVIYSTIISHYLIKSLLIGRHRPSDSTGRGHGSPLYVPTALDRADERVGLTCKESTIVADRAGGIMYGDEAEQVRSSATMSVACSCTTVAFVESVKPGFIGDKKEVGCFFNPLCTRPVQD